MILAIALGSMGAFSEHPMKNTIIAIPMLALQFNNANLM